MLEPVVHFFLCNGTAETGGSARLFRRRSKQPTYQLVCARLGRIRALLLLVERVGEALRLVLRLHDATQPRVKNRPGTRFFDALSYPFGCDGDEAACARTRTTKGKKMRNALTWTSLVPKSGFRSFRPAAKPNAPVCVFALASVKQLSPSSISQGR